VLVVGDDDKEGVNALELAGAVLGGVGFVLLFISIFLEQITPALELLPKGGATKWERMQSRLNVSGRWLLDALIKAALGALVAILLARAF
jgi:hypothetical protein